MTAPASASRGVRPRTAGALRLSGFARVVPAGDWWIVANLAAPSRMVVDAQIARAVSAFAEGALTAAQFAAACPPEVEAAPLLALLLERGIVVAEELDELASFAELVATGEELPASTPAPPGRHRTPRPLRAAELAALACSSADARSLEVLLVGGCVVAFAQDTLVRLGRQRGLALSCRHRWPSPRRLAPLDADGAMPDLAVLQLSIQPFLASVWDDGPFQEPELRSRHTRALARFLARMIEDFSVRLDGGLGLVHNVAPPSISPFGRLDFRTPSGYREIAAEINAAIDAAAARHEHILVIDEERLALRHGGARLFDELLFPFAHHGGAASPEVAQAHQLPALSDALAEEYLACYELFHGLGRVRCVAVDLDGVLWPRILAEDGMDWLDSDTTTRWLHQGLHQALRLLQARGVLLVSLSKGSASVTLDAWRRGADARLLSPEDFVLHSIEWTPKPERLRALAQRLGLQPHDVLFLDDSPVERAEMRTRLPSVQVVEGAVASFREQLLSDPRCEVPWHTEESARRTETTKVLLEREALRHAMPPEDFLASLDIHVAIRLLDRERRARACELLARTTQFNTLGHPLAREEAVRLLEAPGVIATAVGVRDRFAEYGLCGVVMLDADAAAVVAVVLSCRVIGLDVAVATLVGSLRLARLLRVGTSARVTRTSRNAPCHDLFSRAGFADLGGHLEILDVSAVERRAHPAHLTVTIGAATVATRAPAAP